MIRLKKLLAVLCLSLTISTVPARSLPEIIRDGIIDEPEVLEAKANARVAESVLATTEGSRYPVLQGTITQSAVQTDGERRNLMPGIRANWTVYDFGKRNAEIKRDEFSVRYYDFKTNETVEELAYELAKNYLEALKAKMSLDVANENLKRHQEIVEKLSIILEYDPGRRSEYTQAKAREIQVQESIVNYQRSLSLVLQRLNRYVSPPVQIAELDNPFTQLSVQALIDRYHVTEAMAKNHPTYLAQQEEVNRLQAALEVLERGRYPSLDLQAEANKDDAAVYIVFGGDLYNATTQPSIDEQKYKMDAARARLDQVYDSLKERTDVAVIQMREDQARIDIAGAQIKALEQVVVDYEDQFIIAARSLLDVVNAYSELATVKNMQVNANYDLMLGKLDYMASLGVISDWVELSELEVSTTPSSTMDNHGESMTASNSMLSPSDTTQKAKASSGQFVHVNRNGVLTLEPNSQIATDATLMAEEPSMNHLDSTYAETQEEGFSVQEVNMMSDTIKLTDEKMETGENSLFNHYDLP